MLSRIFQYIDGGVVVRGDRITSHANRSLLKKGALEGDLKTIPEKCPNTVFFSLLTLKNIFHILTVSRQTK